MENLGRLAQLVQSIWFTPRGSGVRIPHRPLKGFLAQLVQSIWFTPRGSGVRIPQNPLKLNIFVEFFILSSHKYIQHHEEKARGIKS